MNNSMPRVGGIPQDRNIQILTHTHTHTHTHSTAAGLAWQGHQHEYYYSLGCLTLLLSLLFVTAVTAWPIRMSPALLVVPGCV